MPRYIISPEAKLDMRDVYDHIAADNPDAALEMIADIETKGRFLAERPFGGRARPEVFPLLRSLPVGNYIVFHQVIDDGIDVVRVLHAAREHQSVFLPKQS